MSFVQKCIDDSLPIWEHCLRSDFLKALANGTLEEDCFKGYIVEDSLYLREYAKVFAWGILHAKDMEEIRTYYSLLSFVNESEDSTRRYYLARYAINDEEIHQLPLRAQNQAYVDTMLHAAETAEGPAECMMACLPCMLSYDWIFKRLLTENPGVLDTCYGRFAADYAGDRYENLCKEWIAFGDKACESMTEERQKHCLEIFRACSEHELQFWEMCTKPREDI